MTTPAVSFPALPELEDVIEEARQVAGDTWLHTENTRLAGKTPLAVIQEGDEGRELVRDIVRSIRFIGSS